MRMRVNSNTGKYKSFKEIPLWLKLIIFGLPALVLFGQLLAFVSLENKEFDAQIQEKIERIHTQIAQGRFRDVFIEGDRELVANHDENEFTAKLAVGQKYFAGKYEKTGGNSAQHVDLASKLKKMVGKPALVANYYSFKSDAGSGSEGFYWIIRGDEIKLADYEFRVRNY
jgi:hypothetical protein